MNGLSRWIAAAALLALAGCSGAPDGPAGGMSAMAPPPPPPSPPPAMAPNTQAADAFFERLTALCGQAFEGRIVANQPASPADPFANQRLVMHVRECNANELRIPFHVGADHSRTWVVTRLPTGGLRLKHDHRHEDGAPDDVTMYGGDSLTPGAAERQEFPLDAYTRDLFTREGLSVSLTNVWALEARPGAFVYELARPGRLFRVEFDLTRPVAAPPPPWGAAR